MKVIDCFPFFDEFLILDIRFKELYDIVDKFVIVESKETFTGIKKPLYLTESIDERYPQYKDKIEIIVVDCINTDNPWDREFYQTNHICKENIDSLNLNDNDLILLMDADEIPKRNIIKQMKNFGYNLAGGNFDGPVFYFKLNIMTSERWSRSKYISYKNFNNFTTHRYAQNNETIFDSMWHFSYLKDPIKIQEKIQAFSHQEFNTPNINNLENINNSINSLKDPFGRDSVKLIKVNIDDSYPEYVKENIDILKEWVI